MKTKILQFGLICVLMVGISQANAAIFTDDFSGSLLTANGGKWDKLAESNAAIGINSGVLTATLANGSSDANGWETLDTNDANDFTNSEYTLSYDVKVVSGGTRTLYMTLLPSGGVNTSDWQGQSGHHNQGYPETGYGVTWYFDGHFSGVGLKYNPTETSLYGSDNIISTGLTHDKWFTFVVDMSRTATTINFDVSIIDKASSNQIYSFSKTINDTDAEYIPAGTGKGLQMYFRKYGGGTGIVTEVDNINVVPEPATIGLVVLGALGLLRKK